MNKNQMLSKEEFGSEMTKRISQTLGDAFQVRLQTVRKNNDVKMMGIMVTECKRNISPTIYIEHFFEKYQNGEPMDALAEEMVTALRRGMPATDFDLDFFTDYQFVKEKICFRLVNAEKNDALLKDIPYIPFLDLLITFYYPVDDVKIGKGTIQIRNSHMELWGVDTQELWRAAQQNTKRLCPPECCSMERLMMEMVGGCAFDEPAGDLPENMGIPMYVLTNRERVFGASVILYDKYLDRIAESLGSSFYLLPSSIHEVILLPKQNGDDGGRLQEIVREVNEKELERQDILSDSIYYYDMQKKRIFLMDKSFQII